jgi:glycosyltransferase involved in cell wall biosynthesis
MSGTERVLIFIDHFLPGYKAGGPVRSIANMIQHLKGRYEFRVITSDREYMEETPYEGIPKNEWVHGDPCPILYATPSAQNGKMWRKLIREWGPDTVYTNGIYSYRFSILPLLALRGMSERPRTVLAPRGMLAPGAMSVKPLKKRAFLKLARILGLFRGIVLHATTDQEAREVRRWIGTRELHVVSNLPPAVKPSEDPGVEKEAGRLDLISIARIAPEKNTLGLLESLAESDLAGIRLDLYGPVYDEGYWEKCERAIERMPEGIEVRHRSGISPERAADEIRAHHAFVLLTKGENFGHAILEALLAGRPVILSDRTPWQDVEEKGVGELLTLEDKKGHQEVLKRFRDLSSDEFQELLKRVRTYGERVRGDREKEEERYHPLLQGDQGGHSSASFHP